MSIRTKRFASGIGKKSVAFGTAIVVSVPGRRRLFTCLDSMRVTAAGTAHVVTVMRGATDTTLSQDEAASQATIHLTAALLDGDGNAAAANDYIAVELSDGTWHVTTISSVTSSIILVLASNLPVAAKSGGKVICYGVVGDTYHTNYTFNVPASATTSFPAVASDNCLVRSRKTNEPLIISDSNATATGTIEDVQYSYDDGR